MNLGLCINCTNKAREGYQTCTTCATKVKVYRERNKEELNRRRYAAREIKRRKEKYLKAIGKIPKIGI